MQNLIKNGVTCSDLKSEVEDTTYNVHWEVEKQCRV
jgi:hypothetical protein